MLLASVSIVASGCWLALPEPILGRGADTAIVAGPFPGS